ncbi:hypothetical protein COU61_03190 [Candidatus Pacearchaeota archaeon CG10_big_fil_rev_8_21_14_0_10_35_13]|nr:MAG: hypothetical protein COU61_03190 [Candidatus Pacearchaeota archaeon CG10_big_fil_rev_8_21_14_0_10_35_13]
MMNNLWKKHGNELTRMTLEGKRRKRAREGLLLESVHESFFTNELIALDSKDVILSNSDIKRGIIFPEHMTSELAEETGIHLGDGCMRNERNYYSVKCNKKEEDYMIGFVILLYKRLYNLSLRLMRLPSVSGFESYSKGLSEFKHKVLGIPKGNKLGRLEVPEKILDSKNKKIYGAFIRGLFDTDGGVSIIKTKNNYSFVTITIKSEKLISQVKEMLKKLGIIASGGKWEVRVNGTVMLKKWLRDIGSNNPKNLRRLEGVCGRVV